MMDGYVMERQERQRSGVAQVWNHFQFYFLFSFEGDVISMESEYGRSGKWVA